MTSWRHATRLTRTTTWSVLMLTSKLTSFKLSFKMNYYLGTYAYLWRLLGKIERGLGLRSLERHISYGWNDKSTMMFPLLNNISVRWFTHFKIKVNSVYLKKIIVLPLLSLHLSVHNIIMARHLIFWHIFDQNSSKLVSF